ncbi:hypothetical protein HMPREF1033_02811 [Tannerella sp. 6_1_58FAA_CT1]|jgi:hypothetical protein|nr:hypothetical protein HMPREF1033_02811 [Tannerella sp. 6_1_58FAA_CT1]
MTGYKLINNGNDHRYEFQIDGFVPKIKYLLSKNGEFKKTGYYLIGTVSCLGK